MHAAALLYLREVVRAGSIRKAAQSLHVAASAVNRQILKLEAELKIRLFDRLPDGMRLTPSGEILLRHVRTTLHGYEQAVAEIDSLRGIRSGHVRIATLDSLLLEMLPDVLERVANSFAAVTFSVVAASPIDVNRQLQAGEADLGLTFVAPFGPALQLIASAAAPVGAIMAASHPLATRCLLSFDDLLPYPALIQQGDLPSRAFVSDEFAAFRAAAQVRFASNDIDFIKRMLRAGLGVGFYTRLAFRQEIATGEMAWVPLASQRLMDQRVGLYVPTMRTLSPACNALVRVLAESLATL